MVVLPQPLPPMIATILPRGTRMVMPRSTGLTSYANETSISSTAGPRRSPVGFCNTWDTALGASGIGGEVLVLRGKESDCSGFSLAPQIGDCSAAPQRREFRSSTLEKFLFSERELFRASEKHDHITCFESVVRLGLSRASAAPAHARDCHVAEIDFRQRLADGGRALGQQNRMQPRLQILRRVGGVGNAVEEAAEQAVSLLANRANARKYPIERNPKHQ